MKPRTDKLRKEEEEGGVRGGKDNPIAKQKTLILPLSNIVSRSLFAATADALFVGGYVKPRTDELRKEEEEGAVRGGKDNPIAKQKTNILPLSNIVS